jgi:four helix bundle protein
MPKTEEQKPSEAGFENLDVWKEAMRLAVEIYESFRECRDFGFKDQIQRAATSVSCNIAEGFDRQSNKEFIQFLHIARGSCAEVRTQLYLAQKVKLLDAETARNLLEKTRKISAMLTNLIRVRYEKF